MRKLLLATTATALVVSAAPAFANSDTATFDATATTQVAISVLCDTNLRFGTISVDGGDATISVDAASGSTASSDNTAGAYPVGADSGPGKCTISDGTDGATVELSSGSATWSAPTLSGVSLSDGGGNTLSADVTIDDADGGNVANGDFYIGGALTIPAAHDTSTTKSYSATVTVTVTD